jgi:O-antigen ligase/Flp pilus assembly protein TadD
MAKRPFPAAERGRFGLKMPERIANFLDHARALALLAAGAGILFCLDSSAADPLLAKNFCFAAGAGLLAGLTLMRLWWGQPVCLPRSRAGLAALALVAVQLAVFLAAPSRARSEQAFEGWLLLGLLVFSGQDWLQRESRRDALMTALALGLGLASAWGLAQELGINFGAADESARAAFGSRISAGFGNPNFFGGFLVLALPAALWLALRKPAAWALVALGLWALLATGCKAAWLGLGFQYFAWGHLAWHSSRPRGARLAFLKRWAVMGVAALVLGLALLPQARARLQAFFQGGNESIQFRLQTWQGSCGAFWARPLLGHGQGSFSAVYPAFRPESFMASQMQHSYEVSHPENWVLQILVESGLLGLAAMLAFLWLLLRPLWKAALRDEPMPLALFLSLAGALVCNLASLDLFLPSTFFFFALLIALALALDGPGFSFKFKTKPNAALVVSLGLLFLSAYPGLQALALCKSSRSLAQAKALSQEGQFAPAVEAYDQAILGDPCNSEAIYFKGASLLDSGHADLALPVFDQLQALAPDYVLVHDKRARAYVALGRPADAEAEWERQLALDPWLLPAIQGLSGLYASQGKLSDAARILSAASQRFPDNADLRNNLALVQRSLQGKR